MSGSYKKDKFGQVMQNYFLKSANVILQSRQEQDSGPDTITSNTLKPNKWFNLESFDPAREDLKPWRSTPHTMAPLVIETFLDLRDLSTKQSLVLHDQRHGSWTVNTKKTEIVMERWLIELDRSDVDESGNELPLLYKKLIITIRYLYTMARLLPTYKLIKRLSRVKLTKSPLSVRTRVLDGSRPIVSKGRIGLSKAIINNSSEDHLVQKRLPPVPTGAGSLRVSVSYRKQIDFQLNDNEETLSSHFLNIDKTRTSSTAPIPVSSSLRKAFKSGNTVNSALPPMGSSPLTKIDSSSSITHALKIQRSGSTGAATSVPAHAISVPRSVASSMGSSHNNLNDLSSGGSTPKYSSSFGKVARRSSLRRTSAGTPSSFDNRASPPPIDDDLKDFVKLLDSKTELQISYSPNVQDSLLKFQLMRGKNDLLTESLSTSLHHLSASPPIASQANPFSRSPPSAVSSHRFSSSLNPSKIYGMGSMGALSNESVPQMIGSNEVMSRFGSTSPGSILKRHVGPSNPTIASTRTHAKMHRDSASFCADNEQDDDDELLFTMSDMNLPK